MRRRESIFGKLFRHTLGRAERRVFGAADRRARAAGLQVGRPRAFRRSYRDPRWDSR